MISNCPISQSIGSKIAILNNKTKDFFCIAVDFCKDFDTRPSPLKKLLPVLFPYYLSWFLYVRFALLKKSL